MIRRIEAYIRENQMTEAGNRILVGVSGGADSTCLLCVLRELAGRLAITLEVLHVDHGIRGEAARADAAFVEELCRQWQIPFHLEQADVPAIARERHLSLETAGREVRYEAFARWSRELHADRIAVAHHRSDQAETILMNLFRGSGPEGMSGIRPVRGPIIRPLLCVSREEIEDFLRVRGITWRTDATNGENDAVRNKIRNQLLPFVTQEIHPGAEENILRTSRLLGEAAGYLNRQARQVYAVCARPEAGAVRFDAGKAVEQDPVILSYMLRLAVEDCKGDTAGLTETHVSQMRRLFEPGRERQLDLPGSLRAFRIGEEVIVRRERTAPEATGGGPETGQTALPEAELPLMPLRMRVFPYESDKKIPQNRYTKWFDYDKIKYCVSVRHREEGDYLSIAPSGTKSLRRFFIDSKIPRAERDACTLAADGHHILWVVGYRISEAYKVTPETKMILEISAQAEPDHTKEKKDE